MAQRLPVVLIPKQLLIPLVRNNVINATRRVQSAQLLAESAQCILWLQQKGS